MQRNTKSEIYSLPSEECGSHPKSIANGSRTSHRKLWTTRVVFGVSVERVCTGLEYVRICRFVPNEMVNQVVADEAGCVLGVVDGVGLVKEGFEKRLRGVGEVRGIALDPHQW
jgi:hypothetical protein